MAAPPRKSCSGSSASSSPKNVKKDDKVKGRTKNNDSIKSRRIATGLKDGSHLPRECLDKHICSLWLGELYINLGRRRPTGSLGNYAGAKAGYTEAQIFVAEVTVDEAGMTATCASTPGTALGVDVKPIEQECSQTASGDGKKVGCAGGSPEIVFGRLRCMCRCGCKRSPGCRRIECPGCGYHVGPGCCWTEDGICHLCNLSCLDRLTDLQ